MPLLSTPTIVSPAVHMGGLTTRTSGEKPLNALADVVLQCLDEAKAEDVVTIELAGKSALADKMVIASGRSQRHVSAIADQLLKALKDGGFGTARVEGLPHCDWVLIDAGDVVAHVFRPEVREFYNLEKMWQGERPEAAADPFSA